jgi:hypothetical protein
MKIKPKMVKPMVDDVVAVDDDNVDDDVVVVVDPWLLMLEVAQEGTLLEYLQRRRPGQQEVVMGRGGDEPVFMRKQTLTAHTLLCMMAQVATGLQHLHKFKVSLSGSRSQV